MGYRVAKLRTPGGQNHSAGGGRICMSVCIHVHVCVHHPPFPLSTCIAMSGNWTANGTTSALAQLFFAQTCNRATTFFAKCARVAQKLKAMFAKCERVVQIERSRLSSGIRVRGGRSSRSCCLGVELAQRFFAWFLFGATIAQHTYCNSCFVGPTIAARDNRLQHQRTTTSCL